MAKPTVADLQQMKRDGKKIAADRPSASTLIYDSVKRAFDDIHAGVW